ncbi:MAG: Eco57I restriction-modification methylase domain-containing protein [Alphaproteobacteria bacterium]|nr:Eco57I restriction-modification methylase domain-containing protein [Alphaproteobacteria bacterium]
MDALNNGNKKTNTCCGTPVDVLEQDILDVSPFLLDLLLQDKTTGENIIWACDDYIGYGSAYAAEKQILPALITGANTTIIQPRIAKDKEAQRNRTRKSAEVFTPSWICRLMNDLCDEEWFGRKNVFNIPTDDDRDWTPTASPVEFEQGKGKTPAWTRYVDSKRLEITCGEAPYLVSRYDTTTGEVLPIERRIGVLDRKMRVVGENTENETEWFFWARRAYESTYGYEFQGDNLLLARENLLFAFGDYYAAKFQKAAPLTLLKQIANIIAWNVWQMDGLKDCVPFRAEQCPQLDLFADIPSFAEQTDCVIKDWRSKKILKFKELKGNNTMKFDFCVGNPPYQDFVKESQNKEFAPPVYNFFLDSAYSVAKVVEMIHPARFLYNSGSTPVCWNKKMLSDKHLKVLLYSQNSYDFFSNTDIKGGICITYRDIAKNFGAINVFSPYNELRKIVEKVHNITNRSISEIIYTQNRFNLDELYKYNSEYRNVIGSDGKDKRFRNNIFDKIDSFSEEKKNADDIRVIGVVKNKRTWRFIKKDFVDLTHENLFKWKVIVPRANGSGALGETLSNPLVIGLNNGYTQTFIGIGAFETEKEATSVLKYIKTKFARAMLSVLKNTQHNEKDTWEKVPLQDFTDNSDIDWSKSVHEIDLQLYKKYGLSDEEIAFIESRVKEMA